MKNTLNTFRDTGVGSDNETKRAWSISKIVLTERFGTNWSKSNENFQIVIVIFIEYGVTLGRCYSGLFEGKLS